MRLLTCVILNGENLGNIANQLSKIIVTSLYIFPKDYNY